MYFAASMFPVWYTAGSQKERSCFGWFCCHVSLTFVIMVFTSVTVQSLADADCIPRNAKAMISVFFIVGIVLGFEGGLIIDY